MQRPSLRQLDNARVAFLRSFKGWLSVPNYIFAEGMKHPSRPELRRALETLWRLAHQDIAATLHLIESGYVGPPRILIRSASEKAVSMALAAFIPPEQDSLFAGPLIDRREMQEARRLRATAIALRDSGMRLAPEVKRQIDEAIRYGESAGRPDGELPQVPKGIESHSFSKRVQRVAEQMEQIGEDGNVLLLLVLNHWFESEAAHCGPHAELLYQPGSDLKNLDFDLARTLINLLRDLLLVKSVVTTSLLRGNELIGCFVAPPAVAQLREAAARAEKLLHAASE